MRITVTTSMSQDLLKIANTRGLGLLPASEIVLLLIREEVASYNTQPRRTHVKATKSL